MDRTEQLVSQLYLEYLPAQYTWKPRPGLTYHQTQMMSKQLKKCCFKCGGRIVPQGHGRANGADRIEWDARRTHIKCYKKAKKFFIYGFFKKEDHHLYEGGNPFSESIPMTWESFSSAL